MNLQIGFAIVFLALNVFAENKFWGQRHAGDKPTGAGILSARKIAKPSKELLAKFAAGKYNFYSIDLDQDGKMDYIAENIKDDETCFAKSDFSIKSCEVINYSKAYGFNYEFFIPNGKNNPMILVDLSGDEDSSEFSIKEFDPKTWKLKTISSLLPLIESKEKARTGIYWGYPWDIRNLPIKVEGGQVKVQALFDHKIDSDDSGTPSSGVAILFLGEASQGDKVGPHNDLRSKFKYMSFAEIEKEALSKVKK